MLRSTVTLIAIITLVAIFPSADAIVKGTVAPALMPASTTSGPSEYDPTATPGSHLVIHAQVTTGLNREILHVVNLDGAVALRLRIRNSELQALDSGPTPAWRTLTTIGSGWQRLDIVLEGGTATVAMNQYKAHRVNTSAPAAEGYLTLPPSQYPVKPGLVRYDAARAVAMDAFTNPSHDGGWVLVGDASRIARNAGSSIRHETFGHLEVRASAVPQPTFLAVPVDALGGTFVAEVAANPSALLTPATSMVVLAGISGSLDAPAIEWEIRMERALSPAFGLHLVYHGADGTSAVLSSGWDTSFTWKHVRAVVDEPAGRIAFVIDGAPEAIIVTPAGGLGASEWIALGDLGLCLCDDVRISGTRFDDLAVIDIP